MDLCDLQGPISAIIPLQSNAYEMWPRSNNFWSKYSVSTSESALVACRGSPLWLLVLELGPSVRGRRGCHGPGRDCCSDGTGASAGSGFDLVMFWE